MADVLIVCVREDETQAKALADMFEGAGFSVGGAPGNDAALRSSGAGIVVWSQASIRSRPFLDAAQRVVSAGKAVLACLIDPPPPDSVEHAPAFDLTGWTGAPDDPSLDPLFFAVDRMVNSARAAVGAAAAPAAPTFQPPPQFQQPPRAPTLDPPYARNPRSTQGPPPQTLPPGFQMRSARAEPAPDPISAEAEHWRTIRHSKDPNDFFEYLTKYGPDGEFSEVAELRLKQLAPSAPPAPEPNALRNAARAAQAEPPRAYEPPPVRRAPDPPPPPPPRPEPPRAYEASRAYDPPPQREAPPPPPRPHELRFERDHRPIDDRGGEVAKRSGGGARMFVLLLLVGGAIVAGGFYFGMGDQLGQMFASAPSEESETPRGAETVPPASAPEDVFASTEETPAPDATPLRETTPAQTRAERAAAERAAAAAREAARTPVAAEVEPPVPAPQTSWSGTQQASNEAGPVSLQPSAQASNVPSQVIPLTPPPVATPAAVTPAETRPAATPPARAGAVRWAQRPSAQRISSLYPSRALRAGTNGAVMLDCVVRADFGTSCTVASETPRGSGFGSAALNAVTAYRAQPTLSDGASAVGARTRISIQFQQAPDN